ncbi:putative molybdenum carrier protein [Neorhodopirellula pilleata]|uniref:Putative molybdenum carrier n=1 Tax=Neorhodopirellula pilleata TaxID=2714738 RepID=A0A5C6A4G1_9BACT|nr:putative molybdenum carrier protein [Neorhodopirellula pilleata]TWT94260.1 putative molybdenum carrier [Neorhodopirellula pilleata]
MERFVPAQIISGGQTGVDQGALDAAIALGMNHGGWCPAGRMSEVGPIPDRYTLQEHASAHYPDRTEQNVIDSDATLILYRDTLSGGTALTQRLCRRNGKPFLSVCIDHPTNAREQVVSWLGLVRPQVLNVAGPRESNAVGIHEQTRAFLTAIFG